jgi:type IV secretory pathway VirB10-like protein
MRASTAYFAGIGTVAVAIAAGLGGGLLLGDIMSPQGSRTAEAKRVEQRASPQPIPAMNGAAQPVPFMAATQVAATVAEPQAPAPRQAEPQQSQPQPSQAQPQVQQTSTQPAESKQAPDRNGPASSAAAAPPPAASDDTFAKARDARRADERRKAERRQQWAEKRKWRQREDDLNGVETSVREMTESRPLFREPAFGTGRMTLFDD